MSKATPSGRGGATLEARELVCLISALRQPGDTLNVTAVQRRLGCSADHARKLIRILTDSSAGDLRIPLAEVEAAPVAPLPNEEVEPLAGNDAGEDAHQNGAETQEYFLATTSGLHGARLALTGPEEEALLHAKKTLGSIDSDLLFTCANAINLGQYLSFSYRKAAGGGLERRCVRPERIYRDHANWLLKGHDVARDASRTFRLDRMGDAHASSVPAGSVLPQSATPEPRTVEIRFDDPLYLDVFDWPELELDRAGTGGPATGTIPYYGTTWLVRQIAACGGTVTTSDRELNELAVAYAKKQLNAAGEAQA